MRKRDSLRWLTARPIAHRGFHDASRGKPENSLAAFAAAVESHYAIECDLHLSSDAVPVVFHDDRSGAALTDEPGCVRDLTAAELGDLRLSPARANGSRRSTSFWSWSGAGFRLSSS